MATTSSLYLNRYDLNPEQYSQLKELLSSSLNIDQQVENLRASADEASAHAKAIETDPSSSIDAMNNARHLARAARIDQAKKAQELDKMYEVATNKAVGKPYEQIRSLMALAKTDPLAAKEVLQIHDALELPTSEAVKKIAAQLARSGERGIDGEKADEAANSERVVTVEDLPEIDLSRPRIDDPAGVQNEVVGDTPLAGLDQDKPTARHIPEHILLKYHRQGDKYLDPNDSKSLIFEDKGDRLRTSRAFDAKAIHAMIDVAEARGWSQVKVTGTPEFRRAAWFEAASRGIAVRGYEPTEAEIAAANKAARAAGAENGIEQDGPQRARSNDKAAPAASRANAQTSEPVSANDAGPQPTGRLVKHGEAPYEFNKDNKTSYYLTVQTPRGENRTYWGVDFPRALEESGAQIGEMVNVKNLGRQPVTVTEKVYDEQGTVVGQHEVETHRNKWEVARLENEQVKAFRGAPDNAARAEAAKSNPNLANAFGIEAALQKFADTRLKPGDRENFMATQRELLARDLAEGVALPTVNVRDQSRTRTRERAAEQSSEM